MRVFVRFFFARNFLRIFVKKSKKISSPFLNKNSTSRGFQRLEYFIAIRSNQKFHFFFFQFLWFPLRIRNQWTKLFFFFELFFVGETRQNMNFCVVETNNVVIKFLMDNWCSILGIFVIRCSFLTLWYFRRYVKNKLVIDFQPTRKLIEKSIPTVFRGVWRSFSYALLLRIFLYYF